MTLLEIIGGFWGDYWWMLVITRIPFQDAGHCFLIGGQLCWWRFGCSYCCVDCFGSSGVAQARNCLSVYSQSPWVLMSQQDRELVVVDIIDVHDQQLSVPVLGNGRLCSRRSNLLSKALTPFHTGGWWWWTLKMSTTSNSLFHGQKLQFCLWQQACAVVFTRRTCGWSSHVQFCLEERFCSGLPSRANYVFISMTFELNT